MKGALHQEEIDAVVEKCNGMKIHPLTVPDTIGERHAIVCQFGI